MSSAEGAFPPAAENRAPTPVERALRLFTDVQPGEGRDGARALRQRLPAALRVLPDQAAARGLDRGLRRRLALQDGGQGLHQLRPGDAAAPRRARLLPTGGSHAAYRPADARHALLHGDHGRVLVPAAGLLHPQPAGHRHRVLPLGRDVRRLRGGPVLGVRRRPLHRRARTPTDSAGGHRRHVRGGCGILVHGDAGAQQGRADRAAAAPGARPADALHGPGAPGRGHRPGGVRDGAGGSAIAVRIPGRPTALAPAPCD